MSAADALLDTLPPAILVVGKGGVGKTTCAAALALRAAQRGQRTLVLTTDPARALPDVLDAPAGDDVTAVPHTQRLAARSLNTAALRDEFIERWGDILRAIIDRGTYLDEQDIQPLVDTAFPGGDEIFAALELSRLLGAGIQDAAGTGTGPLERLLVDTAPTGHTLRLLQAPRAIQALLRLLDAMQEKHRFMVRALTRAYRKDGADAFLAELSARMKAFDDALRDPARCAAVMVANDQPMVIDETRRYLRDLATLGVVVRAFVWNAQDTPPALEEFPGIRHHVVPRFAGPASLTGADGLLRWLDALTAVEASVAKHRPRQRAAERSAEMRGASDAERARLVRPLTIVAGKGGVGKTTVACAIALDASARGRVLLVSTDPAPSLADALEQDIPDLETPVVGVPRLRARQVDATAAFARLRAEYSARVDALFESLMVSRGLDMAADRAVVRDLLALAPPGVDEVYALSLLADALSQGRHDVVVVDPAPTGHLLRLLEMPALALAWTHQLMRLMLKYKDVAGLGATAAELLDFAKRLRAMEDALADPGRAGVVLVTLAEPVVRRETVRLASAVRARGVALTGVVWNRADAAQAALPDVEAPVHFQAPEARPAPAGAAAIQRWARAWTMVEA